MTIVLAFHITNELLTRGWVVDGVDVLELESLVTDVLTAAEQAAENATKYTIVRLDNDFIVVDGEKDPVRRVAKFYPYPRVVDAQDRADRLAHELNVLEAKITAAMIEEAPRATAAPPRPRDEFVCFKCGTALDADELPYHWDESFERICLPRVVRVLCPVCQVDREFSLDWEMDLDRVNVLDDAERAALMEYLKNAAKEPV
jgi:hypothetical protein